MAYASERAQVLFGCYRRGDANDPERYVASIAAVLSLYDVDLMREVTDPRTGIQTTEKFMTFMPNAGELKVYCETVAARHERLSRLASLPRPDPAQARLAPPEPRPGDRANVFVPDAHVRYGKLVEWSKTADPREWQFGKSSDGRQGIWVSYDIWSSGAPDGRKPVAAGNSEARRLKLSEDALKAMREADEARAMGQGDIRNEQTGS